MTGVLDDLRFATRRLRRSPSFTVVAVLTLALGVGANTAVFSLVDGVLFKPLGYPEPEGLVALSHTVRDGHDPLQVSRGLYLLYVDEARTLSDIALHQQISLNLVGDGEPERVDGYAVTPGFFETLRVPPAMGRTFAADEGRPGAEQVVILSDGLWRRRFGADPSILGRRLDLSGTLRTVIAIMPADFAHPGAPSGAQVGSSTAQFWTPFVIDPAAASLMGFPAAGIGRIRPGFDADGVRVELQDLVGRLNELRPEAAAEVAFLTELRLRANVEPLKDAIVGHLSRTLWVLMGTVTFVLLIACSNVANLFLGRVESRHHELALRVALGARKLQVLRPLLAESALLAGAGGALGLATGEMAVRLTVSLAPTGIPRLSEVGLDVRVLLFTTAITILSALLFGGLFPTVRYGRADLGAQISEGAERGGTGSRSRNRIRDVLVVAQVALALVLLVGSALMLRSFAALRAADPGFDPENVLVVRVTVPSAEVADNVEAARFFRLLQDRLVGQPGVVAAGAAQSVPLGADFGSTTVIEIEDHPIRQNEVPALAGLQRVEADYFETMDIALVEGRYLQEGDGADGYRAVVVSESLARRWWPDRSALGRRIRQGFEDWYEIVGVVEDVHHNSLTDPAEEMMYTPALWGTQLGVPPPPAPEGMPQAPAEPIATRSMDVVVRTQGPPLQMLEVVRREVRALNPRIALANPRTMESVVAGSTARTSFTMVVLAAASLVALLLGMVGIYGVVSYAVSQRTREIGVRMALGASAPIVRSMVVRQGMAVVAVGVLVGLVAAGGMSSVIASLLYGVSESDPFTYGGVVVALAAAAVLATWLPAQRATRVDPLTALKHE